MSKTRVLITVTIYPLPSRSYDELICTAGILPSGEWMRIYPVPLTFLEYTRSGRACTDFLGVTINSNLQYPDSGLLRKR